MTAIIMFGMLMMEIEMIMTMTMMMMAELAYHHYWAGHYTTHGSSSNIEAHPHMPHATRHTALRKSCCPTICQHLFPIVFSLSSLSPFLLLHFYFFLIVNMNMKYNCKENYLHIYHTYLAIYVYIFIYTLQKLSHLSERQLSTTRRCEIF